MVEAVYCYSFVKDRREGEEKEDSVDVGQFTSICLFNVESKIFFSVVAQFVQLHRK